MTLQIARISEALPEGFENLRRESVEQGIHNMSRLADQWASGELRFNRPGEALFAAYLGGRLAGVGGVTVEDGDPALAAMRMRRLYVARALRRRGVGRALAAAMMQQGLQSAAMLTVNAGTPDAPAFWEAMGFVRANADGWTHVNCR